MKKQINVVLVDDHEVILDGIEAILKREERLNVIGKAPSAERLLHELRNKKVDLIIMDIQMPETDGLQATKLVKAQYPDIKIIILTAFSNDRLSFSKAKDYKVNGYMAKTKNRHIIVKAIYEVMDKNKFITYGISDDVKNVKGNLTTKELEIVKMICQEISNPEIAKEMKCSTRTVERHRNNIYRKIGVSSGVGLALYASQNGLS